MLSLYFSRACTLPLWHFCNVFEVVSVYSSFVLHDTVIWLFNTKIISCFIIYTVIYVSLWLIVVLSVTFMLLSWPGLPCKRDHGTNLVKVPFHKNKITFFCNLIMDIEILRKYCWKWMLDIWTGCTFFVACTSAMKEYTELIHQKYLGCLSNVQRLKQYICIHFPIKYSLCDDIYFVHRRWHKTHICCLQNVLD